MRAFMKEIGGILLLCVEERERERDGVRDGVNGLVCKCSYL